MDRYIAKRLHSYHIPFSWIIGGVILICIGIAALFGYPYLTQRLVADPDAYGRVLLAWLPLEENNFWAIKFDSDWLPLHSLLLRMGFVVWPSFYFTPQVLTFLLGLGSIPLFYLYSRGTLMASHALIATLLFAILPMRVILSSQPLTEGMLLPFILLAAISLTQQSPLWIITGIIGFSVASGIRYEAWYLLPFLWYHITNHINHWWARVIALISTCTIPALWIIGTRIHNGTWFSFLSNRVGVAGQSMEPYIYNIHTSLHLITTNLMYIIPLPILIFAFVGTIIYQQKTKLVQFQTIITILPWYYLFILWLQIIMGTMEWLVPRFYFLVVIFFIPLIVRGATHAYRTKKILFWTLIIGTLMITPHYITYQQYALTYKALLGDSLFKKYAAAWEVINFINNRNPHAFTYAEPQENNYDFVTMISYFTKTNMFANVLPFGSSSSPTPFIIVEKEGIENSSWPLPTAVDNAFFSIYHTTVNKK